MNSELIPVILFYVLSTVVVCSAIAIITSRNPVYSVLFLILTFFNTAGIFLLLGAEFLAMLLVIVYVGAVAVLFLFIVMMLNINFAEAKKCALKYIYVGTIIAILLFVELFFVLNVSSQKFASPIADNTAITITNTHAIGNVMYTDYVYPFQIAGLILLVAMIGAIVLTHIDEKKNRRQNLGEQRDRDSRKSVKLVKIESGSGI